MPMRTMRWGCCWCVSDSIAKLGPNCGRPVSLFRTIPATPICLRHTIPLGVPAEAVAVLERGGARMRDARLIAM
jgi:hypothetical protein